MKHTKLQRLTFFTYLEGNIENKYLTKALKKHRKNVALPQRKYILDLVSNVKNSLTQEEAKIVCLIYCLHVAKPQHGYIDMLVKDMIEETEVELSEDEISRINNLLSDILEELNMPKLSLDKEVAKNIAEYSEDFKKKYGRFIQET